MSVTGWLLSPCESREPERVSGSLFFCLPKLVRLTPQRGDPAAVKVLMTELNSTSQPAAEPEVTMATISKLERLACLQLAEPDRQALLGDLAKILSAARSLTQLDLSAFEPAMLGSSAGNVLRVDEVATSSTLEQALANAPEVSGPYYHVPRVLE